MCDDGRCPSVPVFCKREAKNTRGHGSPKLRRAAGNPILKGTRTSAASSYLAAAPEVSLPDVSEEKPLLLSQMHVVSGMQWETRAQSLMLDGTTRLLHPLAG